MSEPVTIVIPGPPLAWARARVGRGHGKPITPPRQRRNLAAIRTLAALAMGPRNPFAGPVELDLVAEMPIPKRLARDSVLAATLGAIRPVTKPDLSNLAKQVEDGLNSIVYNDDKQIVRYRTLEKRYGLDPKVVVTVREVEVREKER